MLLLLLLLLHPCHLNCPEAFETHHTICQRTHRIPSQMLVLYKAPTLWLLMVVVKWSNGAFYNRAAGLSVLDNDTLFDATHETFASHTDNVTDKFTVKRSTDAARAAFTTSHRIDDANRYTYLNIGVLMASHLGNILCYTQNWCLPLTRTHTLDNYDVVH